MRVSKVTGMREQSSSDGWSSLIRKIIPALVSLSQPADNQIFPLFILGNVWATTALHQAHQTAVPLVLVSRAFLMSVILGRIYHKPSFVFPPDIVWYLVGTVHCSGDSCNTASAKQAFLTWFVTHLAFSSWNSLSQGTKINWKVLQQKLCFTAGYNSGLSSRNHLVIIIFSCIFSGSTYRITLSVPTWMASLFLHQHALCPGAGSVSNPIKQWRRSSFDSNN